MDSDRVAGTAEKAEGESYRGGAGTGGNLEHGSPSSLHGALQALEAVGVVYNRQADRLPTMFCDQTVSLLPGPRAGNHAPAVARTGEALGRLAPAG